MQHGNELIKQFQISRTAPNDYPSQGPIKRFHQRKPRAPIVNREGAGNMHTCTKGQCKIEGGHQEAISIMMLELIKAYMGWVKSFLIFVICDE